EIQSLSEVSLNIEKLRGQRDKIMKELEKVQNTRKEFQEQYELMIESAKSFTLTEAEKQQLEESIKEQAGNVQYTEAILNKYNQMIQGFTAQLEVWAENQTLTDEEIELRKLYLDRKEVCIQDRIGYEGSLTDYKKQLEYLLDKYKEVNTKYEKLNQISSKDPDKFFTEFKDIKAYEDELVAKVDEI